MRTSTARGSSVTDPKDLTLQQVMKTLPLRDLDTLASCRQLPCKKSPGGEGVGLGEDSQGSVKVQDDLIPSRCLSWTRACFYGIREAVIVDSRRGLVRLALHGVCHPHRNRLGSDRVGADVFGVAQLEPFSALLGSPFQERADVPRDPPGLILRVRVPSGRPAWGVLFAFKPHGFVDPPGYFLDLKRVCGHNRVS
jgi:hypothetical protein